MVEEINYAQLANLINQVKQKSGSVPAESEKVPQSAKAPEETKSAPVISAKDIAKALANDKLTEDGSLTHARALSQSLPEILKTAEFQALKDSNPDITRDELAALAPKKMNTLALIMNGPDSLPLPDGKKVTTRSMLKTMNDLSEKYKKSKIPFIDSYMQMAKNNTFVKVFGYLFLPLGPLTFLAGADAKTPARRSQADLSLVQRTLVNSMVTSGEMKNLIQTTKDNLDLLNDLDVKTVVDASKNTKDHPVAAPKMKLLLNYLLTPREQLERSTGELDKKTLKSKLNDPKSNRIEQAKAKLDKLLKYLDDDNSKILKDVENTSERAIPLINFVRNYFDFDALLLNKKYQDTTRDIDPFLTDTLGMSKEQVTKLSENLEEKLAALGIIFDKTATEIGEALQVRDINKRLEDLKFAAASMGSLDNMVNSEPMKEAGKAAQEVNNAVSTSLPGVLGGLARDLEGLVGISSENNKPTQETEQVKPKQIEIE